MRFSILCDMIELATLLSVILVPAINAAALGEPLYGPGDPMNILNGQNFQSSLFNSNRSFYLMQFYNSWCGHCVRYAPDFKKYAEDSRGWNRAVDIGVINCADDVNTKICREHVTTGYPTLKIFWIDQNHPKSLEGVDVVKRDPVGLRHEIIDFILAKAQKSGLPKGFPNLNASTAETIDALWASVDPQVNVIFVVIGSAYIGQVTQLDFSSVKNASIAYFAEGTGPKEFRDAKATSLFRLERGLPPKLIVTTEVTLARAAFKKHFDATGFDYNYHSEVKAVEHAKEPHFDRVDQSKIYVDDIEAAIYQTFYREVPLKNIMTHADLSALRAFLQAIYENIQLPSRIIDFMKRLRQALEKPIALSGDEYTALLSRVSSADTFLRKDVPYMACRGSTEYKRGYTCGMWVMMHTMTAGSYRKFNEHQMKNTGQVLYVIRDYISRFFSCEECREHFVGMAKNLEQEVKQAEDTVLWLWQAHNQVNNRTKGDNTEDPEFPKVVYPTKATCSSCHDENGNFIRPKVLEYLIAHFNPSNMVISSQAQSPISAELRAQPSSESPNGVLSGSDFTIFLVVYAVSITLLFVVFASVVCKRRKGNLLKSVFF